MSLPHAPTFLARLRAILVLASLAATSFISRVEAQDFSSTGLFPPRLLAASPAGAQAGTRVEITLTGNYLDEPQGLLFSHPGIKGEPMADAKPPRPVGPARPPQAGQPPLMTARFQVTLAADVPPGSYDVRFVGKGGVSNPRIFMVGDLPEQLEQEPNNDVAEAQAIPLNSTVHGVIQAPTDVDYFRFPGKKGQRVVVSCLASSIDSRLLPAIELYDPAGKLAASSRSYHEHDALLDCTLPDDGDYLVRACAFGYLQGTFEHFYRLTVSTGPWIDAIFPVVVEPGKKTTLTIHGRNLPGGALDPSAVVEGRVLEKLTQTIEVPADPVALQRLDYRGHVGPVCGTMDGFEYRVRSPIGLSNPFLLTFAQAPVVLEEGDNDRPDQAQEVQVPCELAGRIEKKLDRDWYRFQAKKGDILSIELYGDRLGSPLDLYAVLKSSGPRSSTIVELDDNPEPVPNPFFARGADPSRYLFKVPAEGSYLLKVASRDADVDAGPRHLYRVRITAEQPDFRLVVMPASNNEPDACSVRRGATQFFNVFVTRMDGFNGPITLTPEELPAGVTCPAQTIAAGQKQGALVLSAAEDAPLWTGEIRVKGTATIKGKTVEREARAASITWPLPQNQVGPTISRLDGSLVLAVTEQGHFSLVTDRTTATVKAGTKLTVLLKLARNRSDFRAPVQVTVLGLPGNPQQQPKVTIPAEKTEVEAVVDVKPNVPPGLYTIVFRGQATYQVATDQAGKQKKDVTVILPSPPLILTVVKAAK